MLSTEERRFDISGTTQRYLCAREGNGELQWSFSADVQIDGPGGSRTVSDTVVVNVPFECTLELSPPTKVKRFQINGATFELSIDSPPPQIVGTDFRFRGTLKYLSQVPQTHMWGSV